MSKEELADIRKSIENLEYQEDEGTNLSARHQTEEGQSLMEIKKLKCPKCDYLYFPKLDDRSCPKCSK